MFIIGITGLSCSGKSTLCENLVKSLGDECLYLSMDDYYKELTNEQAAVLYDNEALINFDTPDAINLDLLLSHVEDILSGKITFIPKFDLGSCVLRFI